MKSTLCPLLDEDGRFQMVEPVAMRGTGKGKLLVERFPHLQGWRYRERRRWLALLKHPDAQAIHAHQRAAAARRKHKHRDRRIHDDRMAGRSERQIARDYGLSKSGVRHILQRGRRNEKLLRRPWIEHPTPYPWLPNKRLTGRFGVRKRVVGLPVFACKGVDQTRTHPSDLRGSEQPLGGPTEISSPCTRAREGSDAEIVPDYGQEAKERRRALAQRENHG